MASRKTGNRDSSDSASQLFGKGLTYFEQDELRMAHHFFQEAYACEPSADLLPAVESYLGYTMFMVDGRESEGVRLMQRAISQEFYRADFFLNLGKAYLHGQNRRQAVNAFFNGLKYCPNDSSLVRILKEIGTRKPPVLKFLPRHNFINRWLGKRLRPRRLPIMARAQRQRAGSSRANRAH